MIPRKLAEKILIDIVCFQSFIVTSGVVLLMNWLVSGNTRGCCTTRPQHESASLVLKADCMFRCEEIRRNYNLLRSIQSKPLVTNR